MAPQPISADEELQRLQPILAEVVALGIPVSIDSMKSAVVAWALDAGAAIANDVWGLQRDPDMARLVAARHSPVIIMHNRDQRRCRHRHHAGYRRLLCALARDRGQGRHFARQYRARSRHRLRQDPRAEHDGAGPAGRTRACSACRLLVGASRKRFISTVTPSEPHQRLGGSIAAHLMAAQGGARIIRTHDVAETVQALRVAAAIEGQAMTDTIFITGVVIHARHGVMEHETEVGQRFVIDLELSADLSESSRTDRLADTVSYSNVVATATAAFKNANYKLLERAAGAVADAVLAAFPRVSAVKVTVHKPHAPIAAIFDDVGVVLTRTRQPPSHG